MSDILPAFHALGKNIGDILKKMKTIDKFQSMLYGKTGHDSKSDI